MNQNYKEISLQRVYIVINTLYNIIVKNHKFLYTKLQYVEYHSSFAAFLKPKIGKIRRFAITKKINPNDK